MRSNAHWKIFWYSSRVPGEYPHWDLTQSTDWCSFMTVQPRWQLLHVTLSSIYQHALDRLSSTASRSAWSIHLREMMDLVVSSFAIAFPYLQAQHQTCLSVFCHSWSVHNFFSFLKFYTSSSCRFISTPCRLFQYRHLNDMCKWSHQYTQLLPITWFAVGPQS